MTYKERALEYMNTYGSITSLQAFRDLGNTRLSATIYKLRKDGYIILKDRIKSKNRFGETVYFDKYYLKGDERYDKNRDVRITKAEA